jgi:hypothetical protein
MQIGESLQHEISEKSVEGFVGYMESIIYDLMQTRLHYGSI